jgi:hypothetical protein
VGLKALRAACRRLLEDIEAAKSSDPLPAWQRYEGSMDACNRLACTRAQQRAIADTSNGLKRPTQQEERSQSCRRHWRLARRP